MYPGGVHHASVVTMTEPDPTPPVAHPPVPAIEVVPSRSTPARRGDPVQLLGTSTDPDDSTQHLHMEAPDAAGVPTTIDQTITRVDPAASWSWRVVDPGTATGGVYAGQNALIRVPPRATGPLAVSLTVVDQEGLAGTTTATIPVAGPAYGIDCQDDTWTAQEIASHLDRATGIWGDIKGGASKQFTPALKGLPKLGTGTAPSLIPVPNFPILCFMDIPTDEEWDVWLNKLVEPSPLRPWERIIAVWAQEGDRKLGGSTGGAASFRATQQRLIARAAGHPYVQMMVNLTWYWQVHTNGSRWQEWWPDTETPPLMGWDIYPTGKTSYADPDSLWELPYNAAAEAGAALWVPEFGVVTALNPTQANLQAQANWVGGMCRGGITAKAAGMGLWCTTGPQGNFHLTPGTAPFSVYHQYATTGAA